MEKGKPLMKIINNLGGWDVLRSFNLYNWDPQRVLRELHGDFMVPAFFSVSVVPDSKKPGQNIVKINPDGLGLPEKSFYNRFHNDSSIKVRKFYQ